MTPKEIYNQYKPRVEALLNQWVAELRANQSEPVSDFDEWHDEEYTWNINIGSVLDDSIDIMVYLCESECRDGETNGFAVDVTITHYGGAIVGGFCPYNYTDQLWVSRDDSEAIEERFQMLERLDTDSMIKMIVEYQER